MADRDIRVLGVRTNHPRPSEPSYISLDLGLFYLKGEPVEQVVLTEDQCLDLMVEAGKALQNMRKGRRA